MCSKIGRTSLVLAVLGMASCAGVGASKGTCVTDETRVCFCVSGLPGNQVCNDDGTGWDPCVCPDGGGGDGGAGAGSDGHTGEPCDGLDNDGDGDVDEGCACTLGSTQACYSGPKELAGVGVCVMGTQDCVDSGEFGARWGPCKRSGAPSEEVCDGVDNDCDGEVDQGCTCAVGDTMSCYDGPDGTAGVGACQEGLRTCGALGAWGPCVGQVLPHEQLCVGADEDCDGEIDEGCTSTGDCGPLQQYQWSHEYFSEAHPRVATATAEGCRAYCNSFADTVCCTWQDYDGMCTAYFGAGCRDKWNNDPIGDFFWGVICD